MKSERKRLWFVMAVLVAVGAVAQTRTDVYEGAPVIDRMTVFPLVDGGCAVAWCGYVESADGGSRVSVCTDDVVVRATINVNRCNGLASAGIARVQRALRFDVDAGGE